MSEYLGYTGRGESVTIDPKKTRIQLLREAERKGELADFVCELFEEAKTGKWKYAGYDHCNWNRYLAMYEGKNVATREGGVVPSKNNFIFQLIQEQIPVFVDNGVGLEAVRRQGDDHAAAMTHQDLIDFGLDTVGVKSVDRKLATWGLKLGVGIMKTGWDADLHGGFGGPTTAVVDPRTFFCDPWAKDIDTAGYVIIADLVDLDVLYTRYPSKRKDIEQNIASGDETYLYEPRSRSDYNEGGEDVRTGRAALVLECWIRDPLVAADSGADIPNSPTKPVYPDGRVITVVGNVVLDDRANPFAVEECGHGEFPFCIYQNYDRDDTLFGLGDIEVLEPSQHDLDHVTQLIDAYMRLTAMPVMVVPRDTKIDVRSISNRPGLILQPPDSQAAQGLRFMSPPAIPQHLLQREQMIISRMRQLSGVDEISVDIIKSRSVPATSIALVKEASEKRVRGKIDNKNRAWAKWARQVICMFRQFWPEKAVFRLSSGKEIKVDPKYLRNMDVAEFDVRIVPSGQTQVSRAVSFQQALELDKLGVLGPRESPARRKFLAEASGVKGLLELINTELAEAEEMAAEAEKAATSNMPSPLTQEAFTPLTVPAEQGIEQGIQMPELPPVGPGGLM